MAPVETYRIGFAEGRTSASAMGAVAWMNQATSRHCRCGLKSAPHHRDFRPGKVGVV